MPGEGSEHSEVRDRVLKHYLPAWCASPHRPKNETLEPSLFEHPKDDWSFLTPGLAHWFLIAIDEGVVEVRDGDFYRGASSSEGIFEQAGPKGVNPRPPKLRKESFLEIAAVGMLAIRYGWPVENLGFESPKWALDFLAYVDDAWSEVAIAGEAKLKQTEAEALSANIDACGRRGNHREGDCRSKNHHRKYAEILELQPPILWIVGPQAFAADDPDLVFRVGQRSGGIIRLRSVDASELRYSPGNRRA
jgi:hypothetical protein